jgi:hypothetical protein
MCVMFNSGIENVGRSSSAAMVATYQQTSSILRSNVTSSTNTLYTSKKPLTLQQPSKLADLNRWSGKQVNFLSTWSCAKKNRRRIVSSQIESHIMEHSNWNAKHDQQYYKQRSRNSS